MERLTNAVEDEERMQYQKRIHDLEIRLLKNTRELNEANECHQSVRQGLLELKIQLNYMQSKQERQQESEEVKMKDELAARQMTSSSSSGVPHELSDPYTPLGFSKQANESEQSLLISEIHSYGEYIRLLNTSNEGTNVGGIYILQHLEDGPTAVYQFPVSVPLPGNTSVTVWSSASDSSRSGPTDFLCSAKHDWLTGERCTTILCKPNQEIVQLLTSSSLPRKGYQKNEEDEGKVETNARTNKEEGKKEEEIAMQRKACDEGRHQKPATTTTMKYNDNCENGAPPRKKKSSKLTVPSECSSFVPASGGVMKKKSNGCGSLGLGGGGLGSGKTRSSNAGGGCNEGQGQKRTKTLREEFGCFSSSSQELRMGNRKSGNNGDEFFVCPSDTEECEGHGKGQGWFGSRSGWFSKRCPKEEKLTKEDKGGVCCEKKKKVCCEEKKVTRGGCCEEKKVTKRRCCEEVIRGCCEDKKATQRGYCKETKVTGGCCKETKVTGGCCKKTKVTGGCCKETKVTGGCCKETKVTGGCCKKTKVTGGCCKKTKVTGGCCEETKVTGGCCKKTKVTGGCCEETKVTGGCCEETMVIKKRKMKRSRTCCEEEEEEDCTDPCQLSGRRFDSDCGIGSSRSDPHLASGIGGGRSRRGGGGVRQGGVDELGCPCACRQSDSFAVTTASLMAAGFTVAAMYCA